MSKVWKRLRSDWVLWFLTYFTVAHRIFDFKGVFISETSQRKGSNLNFRRVIRFEPIIFIWAPRLVCLGIRYPRPCHCRSRFSHPNSGILRIGNLVPAPVIGRIKIQNVMIWRKKDGIGNDFLLVLILIAGHSFRRQDHSFASGISDLTDWTMSITR